MKKIKPLIKKLLSLKLFFPIVAIIAILAIVAGIYFFNQYQKAQKLLDNSQQLSTEEAGKVIDSVGKLIELPAGKPTLATVSDINKLKTQPFFARAQNGDKVLIYADAKKAIIWRPSTNKIIEVSNVNLGSAPANGTTAENSSSPTPEPKVRVAIYNGTTTVGLTKSIGDSLVEKYKNIEVIARENASRSDYDKTYIIDFSNNKETADQLAAELKGEVAEMPNGESRPTDTDILVILGDVRE